MRRAMLRILTAIQLTRLTMAFGAVADLWFVILLTQAQDEYNTMLKLAKMPTGAALFVGAIIAVGLFAYGASLNDVLDVRHDSAFSPERPIPAGRIRIGQAMVVTVGALIVAMLGSLILDVGSGLLTLLVATGILFYNAAGKYIPAVGFITVGLIHACTMFIPNYQLTFTLPVWLVMSHAIAISMAVYVLEDKRPKVNRTTIIATFVAWVFWSVMVIGAGVMASGTLLPENVSPVGLLFPLLAVIAFIAVAWWKVTGAPNRAAAEKMKRYGAMWQAWYAMSWFLALNDLTAAVWLGVFGVAGFAAMTMIKEVTGLTGRPVTFRG